MTNVGPVEVRVPRDVAGSFDPQQVRKRQRRLSGMDSSRHEAARIVDLNVRRRARLGGVLHEYAHGA
ncbi:transposase [Nonomuraea sp. NPDC005650]|uniref:transposase n=1 Tax=Nonomuraea sp. NPDC005650 TaxID=3157045 RepID=UPI0033B5B5AF